MNIQNMTREQKLLIIYRVALAVTILSFVLMSWGYGEDRRSYAEFYLQNYLSGHRCVEIYRTNYSGGYSGGAGASGNYSSIENSIESLGDVSSGP